MTSNEICYKYYYCDEGSKPEIYRIVDKIILMFGGITNADVHDFYSVANECFTRALTDYIPNGGQSFRTYLILCISNKCKEIMTRRNAFKRTAQRNAVSIDTPIGDDSEEITIGDMVTNGVSVEDEYMRDVLSPRIETYLNGLTKKQRVIADCIMQGMTEGEILAYANLTYKEYERLWNGMTSFEKTECIM